jgi:predicted enzyme related to lactoylglutathione lyase
MKSLLAFGVTVAMSLALKSGPTPPPALRASMIALGVTDPARSIKFYGETLGLQMVGQPGEVTFFRAGDLTILLNQPLGRASGNAMVGAVEVIFPVDNVSVVHQVLVARGCHFSHPPHEVTPGTWAATFTDPDGHRLTILGPR